MATNDVHRQIIRNQILSARPHPMKPPGCNGWWHPGEKVLLHSATVCPVCDRPVTVGEHAVTVTSPVVDVTEHDEFGVALIDVRNTIRAMFVAAHHTVARWDVAVCPFGWGR